MPRVAARGHQVLVGGLRCLYGRSVSTSDLGPFLKARRGQVQPDDVGLPGHTPRRVTGLRREEVALLAGVSVDYYARLEQGRERNPSPSVLNAIASALCLDPDQREHLFRLADLAPTALTAVSATPPQSLLDLLDAWPATPAMIIDRQLDVLAHNALAGALYSDFDRIDNLARMTFLDLAGTSFYAHWDRAAESCVANLRLALGHVDSADAVRRLVVEALGSQRRVPPSVGPARRARQDARLQDVPPPRRRRPRPRLPRVRRQGLTGPPADRLPGRARHAQRRKASCWPHCTLCLRRRPPREPHSPGPANARRALHRSDRDSTSPVGTRRAPFLLAHTS